jgi:hypothetical protein
VHTGCANIPVWYKNANFFLPDFLEHARRIPDEDIKNHFLSGPKFFMLLACLRSLRVGIHHLIFNIYFICKKITKIIIMCFLVLQDAFDKNRTGILAHPECKAVF